MKVISTHKIREIDEYTIHHEPVSSVNLMERAAKSCSDWISEHFSYKHDILIFCGPGNNGGDGLAVARQLQSKGFNIRLYIVSAGNKTSPEFQINYERLVKLNMFELVNLDGKDELPYIAPDSIIIDALFGSGLSRPVEGFIAELIGKINISGAKVISIDIPSGLFGEDNRNNNTEAIIKATHTLTFQFPKLSFFYAENNVFTGEWHILPIGLNEEAINKAQTDFYFTDHNYASGLLKIRARFSHKGTYGHGLLIAGSYGMMGAALLASKACLKAGAGLVTAHIPRIGYHILQTAVPESLVSLDESDIQFTKLPEFSAFNALAVGPAIGRNLPVQEALRALLASCKLPMVLDADALNILAEHKDWIQHIPAQSILTPHPKEFERLFGKYNSAYERNMAQISFSKKHSLIIVLKGAYTSVSYPDGSCWFNSTGNPGMATGGSGDVLTGIILSLLAQKYESKDAAILGTYIHGLAGDMALEEEGAEGVTASDIIKYIGKAFKFLSKNSYDK